jgi:acetyltransferase-like isoleucine patch superfamily enzyme
MEKFNILHNRYLPVCFVGNCHMNSLLALEINREYPAETVTVEEALTHTQDWFDQRQFFCGISDVKFKKYVIESLDKFNPHYVTFIDRQSSVSRDAIIGHNNFISGHCTIYNDNVIGNHSIIISTFLSHENIIGNYSHLSPWGYFSFTTLGQGVVVGVDSTFVGHSTRRISVPDWCNFHIKSRVTRAIDTTGTYRGNTKLNFDTSLTKNIL